MRYLRAKFTNYIGFLNGMGLDTVDIDFSKCISKIILIKGDNGTGKSTLLSSINLFPDGSGAFVPGKDAEKYLVLESNNDIYEIHIISAADLSGGRKTTKAFISKNGIELNTNGNVSSYKDILYSEFELDTNFSSLTRLTSESKGLGSLTPSERKRFTANIIENLEVYNDMYKNLNKKSSIYKSHINNLHAKIQNIGSKDNIEATIKSLRQREHSISTKIMELNNMIVSIQAKSSLDEEEANKITLLKTELQQLDSKITDIYSQINIYINKTKIHEDDIESIYNENLRALQSYEIEYEKYKTQWTTLSNKLKSNQESINLIEAEINTCSNISDVNLEDKYNESKSKLVVLQNELSTYNIEYDASLIYPLSALLDYFTDLCKTLDAFYEDITPEDIQYIIFNYDPSMLSKLNIKLEETKQNIEKLNNDLSDAKEKQKIISVLSERPSKCNIDTCPYIAKAVELNKSYGSSINKTIESLQQAKSKLESKILEYNDQISLYTYRDSKKVIFDKIIVDLQKNMDKIQLLNIEELAYDNFINLISNMNPFNFIRDPKKYIDILNSLKMYEAELNIFNLLEIQYTAYQDKIKLLNSNKSILQKLRQDQSEVNNQVTSARNNCTKYNDLLSSFSNKVNDEKAYLDLYNIFKELKSKKDIIVAKLDEFNQKSSKALEALSTIQSYRDQILNLTKEEEPINLDITRLTGQLTMLESYYTEYDKYNTKYTMIETLKKYCSPTNGGIQVLFMQLYMNKTLELSNQILGMLFNGEYKLLDFIINSNEFRIPFVGNGLPVDDISNGSSSQVCMMSMIINLVLLYQASTKFNIASLDEADAPLDNYNRAEFVNVLYRIIPLLDIDQLFIISHSIELDSSNVDIIKLKSRNEYEQISGNIIWDFQNEIK